MPVLQSCLAVLALLPSISLSAAVPPDCDYLIITDSVLLPEAERLARMRADNATDRIGKPHVVTMAEVYRDFPAQGPLSRSVTLFLRDVDGKNGRLPDHLLLFGDASLDDASPENRVPSHLYTFPSLSRWAPSNPIIDTATSDDVYAELLDSLPPDTLRLRMAVGRIPAGNLDQAREYVDKVIAYETGFPYGPAAFTYGFANDDDVQPGNPANWDVVISMPSLHERLWESLVIKPFAHRVLALEFPTQPDFTKPAAKDSLFSLINAGPVRLYLIGHASYTQFTDEKLLVVPEDLSRLKAKPILPVVALLSSYAGAFAQRSAPSIGEELLFHPHGAIAILGAVRETYPIPDNFLFQKWEDTASRGGTLGQAFRAAKNNTEPGFFLRGPDYFNNLAFALLGDPGITLRVPALDLVPATGSGTARLVLKSAGDKGDSAYFQVVQVDTLPYSDFTLNPYLTEEKMVRERIIGDGRAILETDGSLAVDLPRAPNPLAASVKVMTWNSKGMRYGHFPLSDLGPIGVRGRSRGVKVMAPYRLVLDGSRIRVEWLSGTGAPVRADLKGAFR